MKQAGYLKVLAFALVTIDMSHILHNCSCNLCTRHTFNHTEHIAMAMQPSMLDKLWELPTAVFGMGCIWLLPELKCPHREPQLQCTLSSTSASRTSKSLILHFSSKQRSGRDTVSIMLVAASQWLCRHFLSCSSDPYCLILLPCRVVVVVVCMMAMHMCCP